MTCPHLSAAGMAGPQKVDGCQDCLAEGETDWVHLRMCVECGRIECCDSSPRRHASAHYRTTGHPVIRSAEPGESWRWCFVDEMVG